MPKISWKERHRRMRANLEEAWAASHHAPSDPGLREAYPTLPRAPIRLITCPLSKDINQGGILRLAEAFRLERIDFSPEADGAIDMAGHRGTKTFQPWQWIEVDVAVAEAKAAGYQTVALTLSDRATDLDRHDWRFPMALVVGGELDGVPPEIEEMCDAAVAIPLYWMVQSLNVAVATGMALQSAFGAFRREHPEFLPARSTSRRLLGVSPAEYGEG